MGAKELEALVERADKIENPKNRVPVYLEAVKHGEELFPLFTEAMQVHRSEIEGGSYCTEKESKANVVFAAAFERYPVLSRAYHLGVVEPMYANRDGWFDSDPVLKKRVWVRRGDTHKGIL